MWQVTMGRVSTHPGRLARTWVQGALFVCCCRLQRRPALAVAEVRAAATGHLQHHRWPPHLAASTVVRRNLQQQPCLEVVLLQGGPLQWHRAHVLRPELQ